MSELNRCYRVLELEPGASLEQVKQAWRELAKVWHPDRFPNDAKMQHKAQERLKVINRAYEVLSQFLESERGEQSEPSAAQGWENGPWRGAKTGQAVPPVPPSERSKNKPSANPKKSRAKIICLLLFAFGVVAYTIRVNARYHAFTNQLRAVRGIHIGDPRDEVKYRLGFPPEVNGPVEEGEFGQFQYVYLVDAPTNDVNRMPQGTKVEDYDEWVYDEPYSNVRLTIEFNKSGFVESLSLYSNHEKGFGWGAIAGLNCGDSEDEILRLGEPSRQTLDGVSKTIEYRDIGIVVTLTKGRAYMISIKGPQEKAAVFRRFMHTLP